MAKAQAAPSALLGKGVASLPEQKWFGRVLRDELIARDITTGMGNPNWTAFAELLEGVHYETLRKAVTGERPPTPGLMEACAKALNLDPSDLFIEYRLWEAQSQFDPRHVGIESALENLGRWAEFRAAAKKK